MSKGLENTLGKGGCRFYPVNAIAFGAAMSDPDVDQFELRIGDQKLLVRPSSFHEIVTDFRFDERLSPKAQNALLETSNISPFYIRKARNGGERATEQLID